MKTTSEQIKDNILIAEFMGLKIITDGISWFDTDYTSLKRYNEEWNHLMPVVENINQRIVDRKKIDFKIQRNYVMIMQGFTMVIDVEKSKLIDTIYAAVVLFVKWFNAQNKMKYEHLDKN